MDNNAIETLSVNAVKDSIDVCDYLQQFIEENDKSPSWDGYVNIYDGTDKSKAHMRGRMPVQIKGKTSKDLAQKTIKYNVEVSDLNNYLYDGGAIYFVVLIHPDTYAKKIYYAELTPIKLRVELDGIQENQKTKVIELKEFPDDNNLKANIFFSCRSDCDKQASFKTAKLLSVEELEKNGLLESLSFSVFPIGYADYKEAVCASEIYMYANIKGSSVPQPIEAIPKSVSMIKEMHFSVNVNNKKYYDGYYVVSSLEETKIKIGNSLYINLSSDTPQSNITIKYSNSLREFTKDIEFIIALLNSGELQIGELTLPFAVSEDDKNKFEISNNQKKLDFYNNAILALDLLGYSGDLVISELTDNDWNNLSILIKAFVEQKPVPHLKKNLDPIQTMDIQGHKFLLVFNKVENTDDTYQIWDFFKTELVFSYKDENENYQRISQYSILTARDYQSFSNVRFDVILPSFLNYKNDKVNIERLNWQLLELLLVYDENPSDSLMKTIDSISEWIFDNIEDSTLPYCIRLINRFQVLKRNRKLTIVELHQLYDLLQQPNISNDVYAGIYLLLDDCAQADVYLRKLDEQAIENFKSYPIYKFHD